MVWGLRPYTTLAEDKVKKIILFALMLPSLSFSYKDVSQARPSKYGSKKNVICPWEIVPGVGIGPLKLNQTVQEIEKLGMDMKTVQGMKAVMVVGMSTIGVTQTDVVRYVEVEIGDLPDCLVFKKTKIKKTMSEKVLAQLFTNCQPQEIRLGGNLIQCDGIAILTGGWGGRQKTPSLQIQ